MFMQAQGTCKCLPTIIIPATPPALPHQINKIPSPELQMNSQNRRNYDVDPDLDSVETQSRPKPGPRGPRGYPVGLQRSGLGADPGPGI